MYQQDLVGEFFCYQDVELHLWWLLYQLNEASTGLQVWEGCQCVRRWHNDKDSLQLLDLHTRGYPRCFPMSGGIPNLLCNEFLLYLCKGGGFNAYQKDISYTWDATHIFDCNSIINIHNSGICWSIWLGMPYCLQPSFGVLLQMFCERSKCLCT